MKPTKIQAETLESWLELNRALYNGALQEKRDAWKKQRVSISRYDQQKSLTIIRSEISEYGEMPAVINRSPLFRVDRAFKAFYRRCKSGEKPGYPRFKSRDRYHSIDLGEAFKITDNKIHIPKLGLVRFHRYRTMHGVPKCAVVKRTARGWELAVVMDIGEAPMKKPISSMIGIDLGLTKFATLSNGETIENPRFFRESEVLLARRGQELARKVRGSNSRKAAKRLLAKAHEKVRNQRRDFACKLAALLFSKYDAVVFEDLQIRNMVKGNLAKSISDVAWGELIWRLNCKAERAGKWAIPIDPRGTSQKCSGCGKRVPKTLGERVHSCTCGLVLDRDWNAAINIYALGKSAVASAKVSI